MPLFVRGRLLAAVVIALAVAVADAHAAQAPPSSSDPGEQIKDGAVKFGEGIKEGAIKVWEAVKAGATTVGDKLSDQSQPGKGFEAAPSGGR